MIGIISSQSRALGFSFRTSQRTFWRQQCRRAIFYSHNSPSVNTDTPITQATLTSKDETFEFTSTEFVEHIVVQKQNVSACDIIETVLQRRRDNQLTVTNLSATELLHIGAVWFLPAHMPRDPSLGHKPMRLEKSLTLNVSDYLRIHHHPRRFPTVYDYDWSLHCNETTNQDAKQLPGVIVAQDETKGYIIIDKPAGVPVHMTVDNRLENVAACLASARRRLLVDNDDGQSNDVYVSTPQRLDQNTSGLLVVASSKPFAHYFANLLARKTENQLASNNNSTVTADETPTESIHKLYKCLVCLSQPSAAATTEGGGTDKQQSWSVQKAYSQLQSYQLKKVRHYLEPSIRSPKRFVVQPPSNEAWPECLLRIRNVGPLGALTGNAAAASLRASLWESHDLPPTHCHAVVELEVELLTGRTHQIRGQLAAMGYSLVGDAQYGGATPVDMEYGVHVSAPRLALQCCELEFIDPDVRLKEDGTVYLTRSHRWNKFRIEAAWWTRAMEEYHLSMQSLSSDEATTFADDAAFVALTNGTQQSTNRKIARRDLLPSRIQLSPGKNKYVLVKATHPDEREEVWFVKSAAPNECGGPYHANVAQDLGEWITAAGYDADVTGGGRIDYQPDSNKAVVYGFSYGYGKGDHMKAAKLVSECGIDASYDYSDELY
ncbi:hypothetical protein MPSEU_001002000 [Mayamaea pseudoterrestris]|nr:hypothetical protein MPSEU_001002000 [Mayamaea pseudoterrestris]